MYVVVEMQKIPEFSKGFPDYWLNYIARGSISENSQINALATTYVRLVEAALREYESARLALGEFWNNHGAFSMGHMHQAVSNFENCLSDMHRAISCFRRLRRHKYLTDALSRTLNDDKPQYISNSVSNVLRNIRNTVHHFETQLLDEEWKEGDFIALLPDGIEIPHQTEPGQTVKTLDRLSIGEHQIMFSDLTAWLKEMARYADKVARFQRR